MGFNVIKRDRSKISHSIRNVDPELNDVGVQYIKSRCYNTFIKWFVFNADTLVTRRRLQCTLYTVQYAHIIIV